MAKELFRVMYRKDGRMKDRIFEKEDEAVAFKEKCKKYGDDFRFERVTHIPLWQRLAMTEFSWLGVEVPLVMILAAGLMIYGVYIIIVGA